MRTSRHCDQATDNRGGYSTLNGSTVNRADMRIVCACGRTMKMLPANILEHLKGDGEVVSQITGTHRTQRAALTRQVS